MFKQLFSCKRQKGLSLIEASMVLVLSAVVVAGVMAYYQTAQTNHKLEKTTAQIMHIVSEINGLYAGSTTNPDELYKGLTTDTLASALADTEVEDVGGGNVIKTPFAELYLIVYPADANPTTTVQKKDHFVISIFSSATDRQDQVKVCQKIVTLNFNGQAKAFNFTADSGSKTILATSAPLPDKLAECHKIKGLGGMLGVLFK